MNLKGPPRILEIFLDTLWHHYSTPLSEVLDKAFDNFCTRYATILLLCISFLALFCNDT